MMMPVIGQHCRMCAKAILEGNIKGPSISVLPVFFRAFP